MNNYYVYIHWRLDTNEPFYIGKGKGDRWRWLYNRKEHFKNIMNKYPIACEIVMNNLTEDEALGIECWLINELVFEYGYSIDIPNNHSSERGCHLVNCTWGGDGTSGMNPRDHMTEEVKKRKDDKMKKRFEGKNNPMYGKHHSEETKNKISNSLKGKFVGENNPNYGNGDKIRGEKNPMHGKHRIGKNSPRAKSVICLTTGKIFFTAKEGAEYYNIKDKGNISKCCKKKYKSAGKLPDGTKLVWMYLDDFLNKCKYIKL